MFLKKREEQVLLYNLLIILNIITINQCKGFWGGWVEGAGREDGRVRRNSLDTDRNWLYIRWSIRISWGSGDGWEVDGAKRRALSRMR